MGEIKGNRGTLAALAATAALLAGPLIDRAAAEPLLGQGFEPSVAISPNGTAHVVWAETSGGTDSFVYCRMPADAATCSRKQQWTSPTGGTIASAVEVFAPSANRVLIVQGFCCFAENYVVESTNGGQSFGAQTLIAASDGSSPAAALGTGETILGPGNSITTAEGNVSTFGPYVQNSPFGTVTTTRAGPLGFDGVIESSIGLAGGKPVLSWLSDAGVVSIRQPFAELNPDMNQDSAWGAISVVDPSTGTTGELESSSGSGGLFLAYQPEDDSTFVTRRYTGQGSAGDFGPPSKVADNARFFDIFADARGGVHASWTEQIFGTPSGPIKYAYSPDGRTWGKGVAINDGTTTASRVATNADGNGLVVFQGAGDAGDQISYARVPPAPVIGESVIVEPVSGIVTRKCKGQKKFTRLRSAASVPVGCFLDTTRGHVDLTSAKTRKATQTAEFWGAVFQIKQKKQKTPDTVLDIAAADGCGKSARLAPGVAGPVPGERGKRKGGLWGSGKGNFTTNGKGGSGSVRGTKWYTENRCDRSTLFYVKSGVITVRDFGKGRTVTVRAGDTYVAG